MSFGDYYSLKDFWVRCHFTRFCCSTPKEVEQLCLYFQMEKLTYRDRLPAYMTNVVMMLLMVTASFSPFMQHSVLLRFLCFTLLFTDWRYICHRVRSHFLPDLHQSCPPHELQSHHAQPRAADGQNNSGHHQPGGHSHPG